MGRRASPASARTGRPRSPIRRPTPGSPGGARRATRTTAPCCSSPLDDNRTRVTLRIEADPQGPVETVGAALGILERAVEGDLKRFKEFIESRGVATGAWRGEIHGETVVPR